MMWSDTDVALCGMSNVKWGAVRDVSGVMHNVANIAIWNCRETEVLVRYEMCEMVRNGVTWNVVWFGIMPDEMAFDVEWCNE